MKPVAGSCYRLARRLSWRITGTITGDYPGLSVRTKAIKGGYKAYRWRYGVLLGE